jgi:hypothetical protein
MARAQPGGPLEQAAAEAVRHYLDALRSGHHLHTKHPSRRATQRRLAEIEAELPQAPPMRQLRLVQERHDLLERAQAHELEDAFVEVARTYSRRHGISVDTWREMGVPVAVLRKAGIRARRTP